jgi:hypothetical protein
MFSEVEGERKSIINLKDMLPFVIYFALISVPNFSFLLYLIPVG